MCVFLWTVASLVQQHRNVMILSWRQVAATDQRVAKMMQPVPPHWPGHLFPTPLPPLIRWERRLRRLRQMSSCNQCCCHNLFQNSAPRPCHQGLESETLDKKTRVHSTLRPCIITLSWFTRSENNIPTSTFSTVLLWSCCSNQRFVVFFALTACRDVMIFHGTKLYVMCCMPLWNYSSTLEYF